MWICTPFGILMPATRPAHTIPKGDKRELQVRTRERAYLDTFRERYCSELGKTQHFPKHDYPWKAYVTREALAKAVAKMTLDIDYEKFKPEAEGPKGLKDKKLAHRLHSCYNSLWSVQVSHGDGGGYYGSYYNVDGKTICEREGHWFNKGTKHCTDCTRPRPRKFKKDRKGGFPWAKGDDKYEEIKRKKSSPQTTYKGQHSSYDSWLADYPADYQAALTEAHDAVIAHAQKQCADCGGGYWAKSDSAIDGEVWVPHDEFCLQDDGCPECWAMGGMQHDEDCSQYAAESVES